MAGLSLVGIRAACLYWIGAGDDLKMFGSTITILLSLKVFVIFWLAEGVVSWPGGVDHLRRLHNEMIGRLIRSC
jgi:hypothetical protein